MENEIKASCTRPTLEKHSENGNTKITKPIKEEDEYKMIKVGKPAPTFTAPAFHNGKFTNVSLEDYKGKWVLLCFYPGDFTFV
jgi:hypothetical protein